MPGPTSAGIEKSLKKRREKGEFIPMRKGEPTEAKHDPLFLRFFEKIDSEELTDALALSDNRKHVEFLRLLLKPKYRSTKDGRKTPYSVASIAKACGLTLGELNSFWRDHNMAKARDIAFNGLPVVMADVVTDSSNSQVVCPRCDGLKVLDPGPDFDDEGNTKKRKLAILRTCPECNGVGTVKKSGDIESRKLLFETTGLTGKKGPLVAIQNNNYSPSSLETFVDTFDKMDAGLPMIEGEIEEIPAKS